MKNLYKILGLSIALLAGTREYATAQCSGQFRITYPGSTTAVVYNNGSSPVTQTYCPDGTGTASFTYLEDSRAGILTITDAAGVVIRTVNANQNQSVTFSLPVSSSGSSRFTFAHDLSGGCPSKPLTIPVDLTPSLNLVALVNNTAVSGPICPGSAVSLVANAPGAAQGTIYTFRDVTGVVLKSGTSNTLDVVPTTSTSYTVGVTNAGASFCGGNSVAQKVDIGTSLSLTSNDADNVFTKEQQAVLTASGSSSGSYTWSQTTNNVTTQLAGTGATRTVTVTTSTIYTVTAANTANCGPASLTLRTQNSAGTLPVTLTGFSAAWAGQAARLQWTTASELNNAYFVVERSVDGFSFQPVARISGKGTTSNSSTYSYLDAEISRFKVATVYYRLAQQDLDGTTAYATVQVLSGNATSGVQVAAFPNPFADKLEVQVSAPVAGSATLTLLDRLGRPVREWPLMLSAGKQVVELPQVAGLPRGLYFLRVDTATGSQQLPLSHE